jgi:hypothetical protein
MDLNLTCSNYNRMTDTNKLLYLIYGELVSLREAIERSLASPCQGDRGLDGVVVHPEPQNVTTGLVGVNAEGEGLTCKYCGEMIPGNRGNLLAHIRKCPERKKEGV